MAKLEDYSFGRITVDGEEQTRDLGAHGRLRPAPAVLEELQRRGVEVEAVPPAEAVRRYGESDARRTAAALHLTC